MSSIVKDKYEELLKAERDRIKGTSFIPSYGKMPVHNEKFNKLINYLDKINKNLQVENPTENQINIQNLIQKQLDMARLDVLLNNLEEWRKIKEDPSFFDKLLFASGFRSWCGAGTDIYENIQKDLDDPNRMFKIDTICRNHDIAYTKSKTIDDMKKADADMVFDIFEKYIVNFKKNFFTGNYKSDFSSVSTSFNTLYNYIISVIEGSVNMFMMYESLKNIGGNIKSIGKYGINNLIYMVGDIAINMGYAEVVGLNFNQQYLDNLQFETLTDFFRDVPKIGKTVGSYYFGTMIRDRIFSMGALLGIVYKTVIEELFDIEILSPTKHDVTDEDLKNIIDTFEELQNKYQKDTNQESIKIGDEWEKEPIEIIKIDELKNDLIDIFKLNTSYIEKRQNILQEMPEPIITTKDEPISEPIDELDELDKIDELEEVLEKMFDIILKKDIEQFASNKDDILTELKSIVNDIDEKINQVPDIPQDIKESLEKNKKISTLIVPENDNITQDEDVPSKETIAPIEEEKKNKTEL
jgi:hypothetical protein